MSSEYDTTLGALVLGVFLNTFLYGLVTFQFAAYHRTKFDDPPATKYTVLFLFILDTFHTAATIYMIWFYVVDNYNNTAALATDIWPYPFIVIGTLLAATVTQTYLGFRIRYLTNNKNLYAVVIILVILSFILGLVCGCEAWIIPDKSELPHLPPFATAWFAVSVLLDVFITTTLVIILTRLHPGYFKMDTFVIRLVRGAIQTGFFASIFALGILITFLAFPGKDIFCVFAIPLGRIYTNTFLDILLTRELPKTEMNDTDHARGVPGTINWPVASPSGTTSGAQTISTQEKSVQESFSSREDRERSIVRSEEV